MLYVSAEGVWPTFVTIFERKAIHFASISSNRYIVV